MVHPKFHCGSLHVARLYVASWEKQTCSQSEETWGVTRVQGFTGWVLEVGEACGVCGLRVFGAQLGTLGSRDVGLTSPAQLSGSFLLCERFHFPTLGIT